MIYDISKDEYDEMKTELNALQGYKQGGDIADMLPLDKHLLIAGATGSGKSVVINKLIDRLLNTSPYESWLILLDVKRVELRHLKNLPHTIAHASDPHDVIQCLEFARKTMHKRYKRMEKHGLRLYDGASIYVLIDELANLLINHRKQIEPIVNDLLTLGRASKVYVIGATQRATRTSLPEFYMANCTDRVALKVATPQESRNILDKAGAEKLPRYGRCIYFDGLEYRTVNNRMIDYEEVQAKISYWEAQHPTKRRQALQTLKRLIIG